MRMQLNRVAVLGSGVMGSAIAAHFANAGIPSLVLDIVPKEPNPAERAAGLDTTDRRVRNRLAADSVRALAKSRPAALFTPRRIGMIETGNLEDDLPRIAEADWVIEAVKEDLGIKRKVLEAAAPHVAPHAVLSSNTSGLPLAEMSRALPEALRSRFLGTHFFNPPRYMKLLELIPTGDTAPRTLEAIGELARSRLGKGVVLAKDTPNFIANRIGVHAMLVVSRVMERHGLTVEEIDALTGPAMGRPKTATFRLADMVGLDTLLFVAHNVREAAPDDECQELFEGPRFLHDMVQRGILGMKSGAGFYKKIKGPQRKILTLDTATLEYREPLKPELPELASLAEIADAGARVRVLVNGDGRGAKAAWEIVGPTLSYAAMRLGEIADDAATIDQAVRWGFNWELGPFEIWDALGFRETTERLRRDGLALPAWVDALYGAGAERLYEDIGGHRRAPTAKPGERQALPLDPRVIDFEVLRKSDHEVKRNESASLLDLGDGVLGLEFHSKMNALDDGTIDMIFAAADEAERNWQAVVVANYGDNFCAGANLKMLLELAGKKNWDAIEKIVARFQEAGNRMEYCGVPVVVAPHGMALGGGCEVVLAGNAVRASAESYVGLVEIGAGLIPAGGGCMRFYRRHVERLDSATDAYSALKTAFETIGQAKVSTSAEEARELGFLGSQDGWSMNRDHLVGDAKRIALALARSGYCPPFPRHDLPVLGRGGLALLESAMIGMVEGRFISPHDRRIGRELAQVLAGGDVAGPTQVSERHLLDLERESFLRLCGESKTQERMLALLKTGKPLRN